MNHQSRESFTPEEITIPPRLREAVNEQSVVSLMQSIERIGLRTPLTVRWGKDGDEDAIILVAGRHRLEACKRLKFHLVECIVFEGSETDARLWEIAENLHRADLTVVERAEHIAEWVRLTGEKVRQLAAPLGGLQPMEKGIRKAAIELGVSEKEGRRAVKIASMSKEAKEAAREAGLDDNQSALMRVASEQTGAAQLAAIKREQDKAESHKRIRLSDRAIALSEAEYYADWIKRHADTEELPTLISWLECCKPKDVIAALRRSEAA